MKKCTIVIFLFFGMVALLSTAVEGQCEPNPCLNGGRCSTAENPYGWGYYCVCPAPSGGRRCQFVNPCVDDPCTSPATRCYRGLTDERRGRYCYDNDWNLIEN